jgi:hypothetical protein
MTRTTLNLDREVWLVVVEHGVAARWSHVM